MSDLAWTDDQAAALDAIDAWMRDPSATTFILEGGAGTGKTVLVGEVLRRYGRGAGSGLVIAATPTHKASQVLRRKLTGFGVPWVRGYDERAHVAGNVITGTTAALLGIVPTIDDDQDEEVRFGRSGKGILAKVAPSLIVIDEVSMLPWGDFNALRELAARRSAKLIAVGDAGQLPPVKAKAIPFDKFRNRAALRQVVRQAEDSAIIRVAWAIREGRPWHSIQGPGVERHAGLLDEFLSRVRVPRGADGKALPEEERTVFVAYRNRRVDTAQERACQRLYGHGAGHFGAGELVLSESNFYGSPGGGGQKKLLCANQDELTVERFDETARDPVVGVPVRLKPAAAGAAFWGHYLSEAELGDKAHPYNVRLRELQQRAAGLQSEYQSMSAGDFRRRGVDDERRAAWREYFGWRDQTIISFRHPFAITSHKSQGSTYGTVFADATDLGRFSSHGLYVAATRPRETLALPLE